MEQLRMAIADITLLIGTCRAMRELRVTAATARARAHWHFRYRDTRRAAEAYVEHIAHGEPASDVPEWRASAEAEAPGVLEWASELEAQLRQSGGLDGWAVIGSDLARLCALAQRANAEGEAEPGRGGAKAARAVGQCVRAAILAYARVGVRGDGRRALQKARRAAADILDADRLARKSASLRRPVRALRDDWGTSSLLPIRWCPAASHAAAAQAPARAAASAVAPDASLPFRACPPSPR